MPNTYFLRFLIVIFLNAFMLSINAQKDSLHAPYLLSKRLPAFTVMRSPDSTSFATKDLKPGIPTIFIVFNPDCEFCQHETRDLLKNIQSFKNAQIVMVSYMPFEMMNAFYRKYKIDNYSNIVMAHDGQYIFLKYYKLKMLPATIVYDGHGRFKKIFRERADMKELLDQTFTPQVF